MPGVGSSAYTTLESVLNLARVLVNDALVTVGGEILTDSAPFTFPLVNFAAAYLSNELSNNGVQVFTMETVLTPVLAIAVNDPGAQVNISDTGYFDGVSNHAAPQLPTNLLEPLNLWERQTGSTAFWTPMVPYPDGLPPVLQNAKLSIWEYRGEAIYMPGATQSNDVRLRFKSTGIQFVTPSDSVMIRGADPALANLLAAAFINTRNPSAGVSFAEAGDALVTQLVTAEVRSQQRIPITRHSYGGRRPYVR